MSEPIPLSQLDSLTDFMRRHIPPRAMNAFKSEMHDASLKLVYKDLGMNQRCLGVLRYYATLSWQRFPYRECPPAMVYALLLAWLKDHRNPFYDELGLGEPDVDIRDDDELGGLLDISIELADSITVTEDTDGDIPCSGRRYRLAYPEFYTVSQATIAGAPGGTAIVDGDDA